MDQNLNRNELTDTALTSLTNHEIDTLGETLNISMGAAATAISSMLDRKVSISTPHVTVKGFSSQAFTHYEPAVVIKIFYVEGIDGCNIMLFRQTDMQVILKLLMGDDAAPEEDFVFDELSISAACEVMNQMMGGSATALSEFLSRKINISTPEAIPVEKNEDLSLFTGVAEGEEVVTVSFGMHIEGVMDTDFACILNMDLAKTLVPFIISEQEKAVDNMKTVVKKPEPKPAVPQAPAPQQPSVGAAPQTANYGMNSRNIPETEEYKKVMTPPEINEEYSVQNTQFPQFEAARTTAPATGTNMDLLMNVSLDVSVEIGKAKRKIKDIVDFGQGTVIELSKQAGAPVDVVVNGCLLARGDVVVIDDNFGVRITEIVGAKELLESLNEQNEI